MKQSKIRTVPQFVGDKMNKIMDRAARESDSWMPLIAGSALLAFGISQRSRTGTVLAVVGGGMALTGV